MRDAQRVMIHGPFWRRKMISLLGGFCVAEVKHNGRAEARTAHELIVGPTGCGKTWLACALGNAACRQGLWVQYPRATRLLDDLRIARTHGSYNKKRAQAQDLLEVVDDRHGACSLLITRQLPVEHWHDTLGDPTRADAILDRVCHSAHKLLLKGNPCEKPPPKMTRILTHREHLN